jgi:hypothetical protein
MRFANRATGPSVENPILALAAAVFAVAALSAHADGVADGKNPSPQANHTPDPFDGPPLGPVGLDGYPPTPLCRKSLGAKRYIHCLHNIVWHGGKTYFIDDTIDAPPPAKR